MSAPLTPDEARAGARLVRAADPEDPRWSLITIRMPFATRPDGVLDEHGKEAMHFTRRMALAILDATGLLHPSEAIAIRAKIDLLHMAGR